jgi:hypothetical protein
MSVQADVRLIGGREKKKMARPEGFEPPTPCSGGTCSIHLSYGRTEMCGEFVATFESDSARNLLFPAILADAHRL